MGASRAVSLSLSLKSLTLLIFIFLLLFSLFLSLFSLSSQLSFLNSLFSSFLSHSLVMSLFISPNDNELYVLTALSWHGPWPLPCLEKCSHHAERVCLRVSCASLLPFGMKRACTWRWKCACACAVLQYACVVLSCVVLLLARRVVLLLVRSCVLDCHRCVASWCVCCVVKK